MSNQSTSARFYESVLVQGVFVLACLVVVLTCTYLFIGQMMDHALTPDWPWLYRAGLYITEHSRLPETDLFSWTHPHQPWVLYQWLFEVIAAAVYRVFGQDATVAAFTLTGIVIYMFAPALALRRRGVPVLLTLVIGALVLLPVSVNFGLRPMLATTVFLLVQYLLISEWRALRLRSRWLFAAITGIYLLWANMHLGVVLGFLSLTLFAVGDLLDRRRADSTKNEGNAAQAVERSRLFVGYACCAAIGFLASLINPYGATIYVYIVELSLKTEINQNIRELMSPDMTAPAFMLGAALVILYLLDLLRARSRYASFEILHVLVFVALTACALRFVVWAGLFYGLVMPAGLWRWVECWPKRLGNIGQALRIAQRADRVVGVSVFAGAVFLITVVAPLAANTRISGCTRLRDAIVYASEHYPANVRWFSDDAVGSCTILVAPQLNVFADTRFDMYPPGFVQRWIAAMKGQLGWLDFIRKWDVQMLIVSRDTGIAERMSQHPRFTPVYRDNAAVVFDYDPRE